MPQDYDAIIVGARCAGSPTAMLLARKGYRVLVVDRATFPSDTVSTHVVQPLGVAALARWGLLDRLVATGCPPIHTYTFDFGPVHDLRSAGHDGRAGGVLSAADRSRQAARRRRRRGRRGGPRRLHGRGGRDRRRPRRRHQGAIRRTERRSPSARGSSSAPMAGTRWWRAGRPARAVQREAAAARRLLHLLERSADGRAIRNLHPPAPRIRGGADPRRPDADGRRMAVRGVRGEQEGRRGQLPEDVRSRARRSPIASAAPSARRRSRARPCSNFFRKPYGPGWALVGDAGYNKDPITAQGISDAFRDAEHVRSRWIRAFTGARSFDDAMGDYQRGARRARRCRCTSSPASSPRWSRRRPRCSSCSARSTAISRRWTPSRR